MTSKNAILELAPNAAYWHATLNTDDVLVRTTDSTQKIFIGTTSNAEPALTISGNNLHVAGTMTANSYSNLPADPAGSWASNQSGAGVYASNAVPQGTFASNAIVGAAGGITFSSNLAVAASAAALFGSNLAVWSSNTLPTLNGAFSSNTSVFGSNIGVYNSNALPAVVASATFGSNTAVSACNLAVATSNAIFPQAAFGSNIGVFASNLAIWASNASANAADAWSSNTAVFGSNQANTALTVAQAASNIAVGGSNDASAGHLLAISTSNFAYPLGTYNSNTANTALTTSLWASNNGGGGGGGGSASYWELSNSLQYSMSNVSIGSTSNMYPLQVTGSIASAGLIIGRGVGALNGIPPTPASDYASNAAAVASPSGKVSFFAMSNAPTGWLECNGGAVLRATYAALFAAIGTLHGAGDGTTTFNVPELRGEFMRGWDHSRGIDSGRAFGSSQSGDIQSHSHVLSQPQNGASSGGLGSGWNANSYQSPRDATQSTGGTETRPRNIALLACIKT